MRLMQRFLQVGQVSQDGLKDRERDKVCVCVCVMGLLRSDAHCGIQICHG